jgi:D-xylose transport system substrate-binding protein
MNKKGLIGLMILIAALIVGGGVILFRMVSVEAPSKTADNTADRPLIGFALGTLREERWQKDADLFTARANALGADVEVKYSGEDGNLQISQAENLIVQGAKVLVVVPFDAATSKVIVEKAHAAGIKVIAYDRMIPDSDVDLFLTFDSRKLGELQAAEILKHVSKGKFAYIGGSPTDNNASLLKQGSMKVLNPGIKNKSIALVVDEFSPGWHPEEAYKNIKAYLASGKTLDAVVAANDGTAGGAVQALKEYGLAGKVPVSGQDADLAACQRIVQGTQTMTIYKPLKDLANKAAEEAMLFAEGKPAQTNDTLNNGKIDVPSYFLDPVVVTKENMDSAIIASGFHTRDEVYGKQ